MNNHQPYGVIFDMDGVLVLSYQPHFESWKITAREYGWEMSEPQFAREFGRTSREIIHALWGNQITDDRIREFDTRKEAVYRDLIRKNVPATPGLHQLLQALADDGAKMAVGTSGPVENVNIVLDSLKIRSYFSAIVTAGDVKEGKPNPEVFLVGAKKLGLAPSRCVVIEDAPPGLQAARNAGMKCIALTTSHPADRLTQADLITHDLTGVTPQKVRSLIPNENGG